MTETASDRIAKLKAKLSKLETAEKAKAEAREMRRKIIVGGAVLAAVGNDADLALRLRVLLETSLKAPTDRSAVADLLKA